MIVQATGRKGKSNKRSITTNVAFVCGSGETNTLKKV